MALDAVAEGATRREAAARVGVEHRTVSSWVHRAAEQPGWPTEQYIADWVADEVANGAERARRARQAAVYRKVRYLSGPKCVDSTGTVRRMRALGAIGWDHARLGEMLGLSKSRMSQLASGRCPLVRRETVAAVCDLYDALSMTPGPSQKAREMAAAQGWVPPLAWDDDEIDDPKARPHAKPTARRGVDEAVVDRVLAGEWRLRTSKAEKVEIVARWLAGGRDLNTLEARTGWNARRYVAVKQQEAEAAA